MTEPLNENGAAGLATDDPNALNDESIVPSGNIPGAGSPDIRPEFSYIRLEGHGKDRNLPGDHRRPIAEVRQWVADGFNVGVRPGQSACWVLDVDIDVHTGQPSPEWTALLAEYGLPATYTVRSPSGGLHYYFRVPPGVEVRDDTKGKAIASRVDVKASANSYVVAAGCFASYDKHGVHFEGTYDVIDDSLIAQTPDWIAERFRAREEQAAEKAQRVSGGEALPKAEAIDPGHDQLARQELNALFAKVDALRALPEGESLEVFGELRGWERGAGFFTLACKIIEVARWPNSSVTVEQAHAAWLARVPGKYATHDWDNALESAGPTWEYGDRQAGIGVADIFDGVPSRANLASADSGTDEPGAETKSIFGSPRGALAAKLFKVDDEGERGKFLPDLTSAVIIREGRIAFDNTGSIWTYADGVYVRGDEVILHRLAHLLGDDYSTTRETNVKRLVRSRSPLLDLSHAPDPSVMNFRNGVLRWKVTDNPEAHDPEVLSSTQFPYQWDPAATCPRFDHWLATMLEPDQITLAWKVLGYMMLSGNPLQVAVMLYGEGSNGKSTFAHVVEHLVGDRNVSAVPLKDFNERFSTSAMIGKIANIVGDIDSGYQVSTAALKQITGADALQFERKNKDGFRATLWATCLFSANKIPGTNDRSKGYAERWVPIHFKRNASERRIVGFSEELLWEEIPGIATKAVRALRTMPLEQGSDRAAAFDLTSESARAALEEFRESSNSFYEWVKNCTVPSETEVMKPKELWQAFKTATGSRVGGTNCPKDFAKVLADRYGEPKTRRGEYLGVQRLAHGLRVAVVDDDAVTSAFEALLNPSIAQEAS